MELLSGGDDEWISSGGVEVKGKGHMDTFLWAMPEGFLCGPVNAAASSSSSVRISFLDLLGACKGDDASHQGESGPLLGFSARLDFLTMMSETDRSKRLVKIFSGTKYVSNIIWVCNADIILHHEDHCVVTG